MEKNNTEKLKEVLSQTISQDNIEKKLKENIQKKNNKKTSTAKKTKHKIPMQPIPKVIPQTKPKIKNTNNIRLINYIFYSLCLLVITALTGIIYYLVEEKKDAKPEVIIKKVIQPQEVIKEKIVTKIVDLDNKNFRKFYYTQKSKSIRCYDFKTNSSLVPKSCKDKISNFIKNTKNLTRVEIIAVVSEEDTVLFKKIQNDIKNQSAKTKEVVKHYLTRGFSRERVIETSSFIRKNLNDYVVVTPKNYYVKSAKNNKGVIVKGFYTED